MNSIVHTEKMQFINSSFNASIQGDNIVQSDFYGNSTAVGITNNKALELINENKELRELLDKYTNKLIELGVIEKEKTQEDIIKEQSDLLERMSMTLSQVQTELVNLQNKEKASNDKHSRNNESSPVDKPTDGKPTRKSSISTNTQPN